MRKVLKFISVFIVLFIITSVIIKVYNLCIPYQLKVNNAIIFKEPLHERILAYYYKFQRYPSESVYQFLRKAYYIFGIPKKGIIHIGARYAEELRIYKSLNIRDILWIEADPEAEQKLKKVTSVHPGSKVAIFAAINSDRMITLMKTSNDGHSSSILKLKNHLFHYPNILETKPIQVHGHRLDKYLSANQQKKYNILVLDVQGAELVALSGAVGIFNSIDAIIAETNYDELYDNGVLIKDLDAFLANYNFTRVDSISGSYYTGDALYVKDKFFKPR